MNAPPVPKWRSAHQWQMWLAGLVGSRYDGLHNFHVAEPGALYRCGQPRVRELDWIRREHGLRTIVCARGGTRHPLRGRWFRKEQRFCQTHGIALAHMKFSNTATPPDGLFDRYLALVADPANHPVLVHCEQGIHRTGVLVAIYRIRVQGWERGRALDEMRRLGFDQETGKRKPLFTALTTWLDRASPQPRPSVAPPSRSSDEATG